MNISPNFYLQLFSDAIRKVLEICFRCALDKLELWVCKGIELVMHNLKWIIKNHIVFQIKGKVWSTPLLSGNAYPGILKTIKSYQMYSLCICSSISLSWREMMP